MWIEVDWTLVGQSTPVEVTLTYDNWMGQGLKHHKL